MLVSALSTVVEASSYLSAFNGAAEFSATFAALDNEAASGAEYTNGRVGFGGGTGDDPRGRGGFGGGAGDTTRGVVVLASEAEVSVDDSSIGTAATLPDRSNVAFDSFGGEEGL